MASKLQEYRRMSEEAQKQLTGSLERWQSFLYEDRQSGNITERNYQMMCRRYEDEQTGLEQAIRELTAQRAESDTDRGNAEQFSRLIKEYAGIEELSASLLNALIEKITVGEPQGYR